jgi:hypothetical protein
MSLVCVVSYFLPYYSIFIFLFTYYFFILSCLVSNHPFSLFLYVVSYLYRFRSSFRLCFLRFFFLSVSSLFKSLSAFSALLSHLHFSLYLFIFLFSVAVFFTFLSAYFCMSSPIYLFHSSLFSPFLHSFFPLFFLSLIVNVFFRCPFSLPYCHFFL